VLSALRQNWLRQLRIAVNVVGNNLNKVILMKNIELEHCIFTDDGEVEIEGVGKISNEEMQHIVAYWLEITSDNKDCAVPQSEIASPKSADADFAQS
jgi:pyruvate kinase